MAAVAFVAVAAAVSTVAAVPFAVLLLERLRLLRLWPLWLCLGLGSRKCGAPAHRVRVGVPALGGTTAMADTVAFCTASLEQAFGA